MLVVGKVVEVSGWRHSGKGGGCTQFVQGRSRMTIGPRISTMPGRSTSGFPQPGKTLLAPSATRREVFGEPHGGELHPSKNRSYDGLRHLVPIFLLMHDSAD